jgi:hypothetical protein
MAALAMTPTHGADLTYTLRVVADSNSTISGFPLTGICCTNPINDNGTVVFFASFLGGLGFFTPSNVIVKTGDTIAGVTLSDVHAAVSVNNSGEIVFLGDFNNGNSHALFNQTPLIINSAAISGPVALDNNGNIAFSDGAISTPTTTLVKVGDRRQDLDPSGFAGYKRQRQPDLPCHLCGRRRYLYDQRRAG